MINPDQGNLRGKIGFVSISSCLGGMPTLTMSLAVLRQSRITQLDLGVVAHSRD